MNLSENTNIKFGDIMKRDIDLVYTNLFYFECVGSYKLIETLSNLTINGTVPGSIMAAEIFALKGLISFFCNYMILN
jgi:hypothetical protein